MKRLILQIYDQRVDAIATVARASLASTRRPPTPALPMQRLGCEVVDA